MWFNAITKAAYRGELQTKSMDYLAKYPRFWRVSLLSHRRIASVRHSLGKVSNLVMSCSSEA